MFAVDFNGTIGSLLSVSPFGRTMDPRGALRVRRKHHRPHITTAHLRLSHNWL
jgi:hypothetical protein